MNEFGHSYEGQDESGNDVYSLVDEGGSRVVWSVESGDDSRSAIQETIQVDTPPEPEEVVEDVYQPPEPIIDPISPPDIPATAGFESDTVITPEPLPPEKPVETTENEHGHQPEGIDSSGNDVYSLIDEGGSKIQWSVPSGSDSRAAIQETIAVVPFGEPVAIVAPVQPITPTVAPVTPVVPQINPPIISLIEIVPPVIVTPVTPPQVSTSNVMNENGHQFIGQDQNGNDVYQLVDEGGTTVRWTVAGGDDSRTVIPGTISTVPVAPPPAPGQVTPGQPAVPAVVVAPPPVVSSAFNPTHRFVGKDASGNDVFQLINESGQTVEWKVRAGDDSRNMLPGSVSLVSGNEATPSRVTTPVVTAPPIVNTTGATADPTHRLVGTDNAGNQVYRLTDEGGNVVQWTVKRGDDSRNAIPGTMQYVSGSYNQPTTVANGNTPAVTQGGPVARGGPGTGGTGTTSTQTTTAGNPTHLFVGRDRYGNDVYQLTDEGGNLVEWAVKHGDDSRTAIAGTVKYVNAGSPSQVDPAFSASAAAGGNNSGSTPSAGLMNTLFSKENLPKLIVVAAIAILTNS